MFTTEAQSTRRILLIIRRSGSFRRELRRVSSLHMINIISVYSVPLW
jgi:hypothetical protein